MRTRRRLLWLCSGLLVMVACGDPLTPADLTLTISGPADGADVLAGDTIVLAARVTVANGDDVDLEIAWATDPEGPLGTGDTLRVAFLTAGQRIIEATIDFGAEGTKAATWTVAILPNGNPQLTAVSVPARAFDRDTIPLVATASDAESGAEIVWLDGATEVGRTLSGDTLWWTPGGSPGDRTLVARAVDAQGFAHDSAVPIRVTNGARIRWTAIGARRAYGTAIISDWGAITALAPSGDIAVGFFHGQPCHACLWLFSPAGALRWQIQLDQPLGDHSAGLTVAPDGSLYALAYGGWLYRIGPDGAILWRRQGVGLDPHGRFALEPAGRLFVAANTITGGILARLDPATGNETWRIQLGGRGYSGGPTVVSDGSIGAQLGDRLVRADANGVFLADTVSAPAAHYMSAADGGGLQYLATGNTGSGLVAINADNTVRWMRAPGGIVAEPVIGADTVLYMATRGTASTEVIAVGHDGAVRWRHVVSGASWIPRLAVLADGSILVAAGPWLHRLAKSTGAVLDALEFPSRVQSALAVAADGTIYLVIEDGRLLALRGWAPLDPDAPWPIWRRDNRRTASVPRP